MAVYTNIGADHLDRHGTVEAYRAVKARLAELTAAQGRVVLNADDPGCRELGASGCPATCTGTGWNPAERRPAWAARLRLVAGAAARRGRACRSPGSHMLADVLAAALAASLVGRPREAIAAGIRTFAGVPHRLETRRRAGRRALGQRLAGHDPDGGDRRARRLRAGPVVLIAGGKDKGLDYPAFADAIAGALPRRVLIGETADELEELIAGRVPVVRADGMDGRGGPSRPRPRSPATWCCWLPQRPASTCSPTTRRAATPSAPRSARLGTPEPGDDRRDRRRHRGGSPSATPGSGASATSRPTRSCSR